MECVLALDQGTTGTTAMVVGARSLEVIGKETREFPQHYPAPGLVEHDLDEIWNSLRDAVSSVLKKHSLNPRDIISVGITNQRETVCPFLENGTPTHRALVWQDRRTSVFCSSNKEREKFLRERTGLALDPYFSATKIRWLLQNCPKTRRAHGEGSLRVGTVDTYLLHRLTGGEVYSTEATNASRTLLMDIHNGNWDQDLGDIFDIDTSLLPSIQDSFGHFGKTKNVDFLPDGIEIDCVLGDQQAALMGQAGFNEGDAKCTYGTGSFIVLNTGIHPLKSSRGLLTTIAYRHEGQDIYALEGSSYIAGAAVQWLRDCLGLIKKAKEVEKLAREVKNFEEVRSILFFPFFTGIASPHWKSDARAAIVGLSRDSGKAAIARATLEGIAFSINDIIDALREETSLKLKCLRVDGGASSNNLLMEIQATLSGIQVIRPKTIETTAYGAALGALIGRGLASFEDMARAWRQERVFQVNPEEVAYFREKSLLWKDILDKFYL